MIAMEAESLKLRSEKMYQAELFQGDSGPGSVRIEIKQVKADSEGEIIILACLLFWKRENSNFFSIESWLILFIVIYAIFLLLILFFKAKVPSPTTTPSTEEDQNKVENWPEQTQRQPMKPLMDPQVVQEFLLGKASYFRKDGF